MRSTIHLLLVLLSLASTAVQATEFLTPEAAISEYRLAFESRDVARFLAVIDFRQEALEVLKRQSPETQPEEAAINSLAEERQRRLREHFESKGFNPPVLDNCRILSVSQDSDVRARAVLLCTGTKGPNHIEVRAFRSKGGWKVVRYV